MGNEANDEAVDVAERARTLREANRVGPAEMHFTYIVLAEALARRSPSDLEQARQRAREADKTFEKTERPGEDANELRMFESAYGPL